ncbi:MAG: hypothetical protein JHC95_22480 [Solirubrobacteraceae bacterium]|nr:hypothetical protein [Solirubrobacteraceae bacterium]
MRSILRSLILTCALIGALAPASQADVHLSVAGGTLLLHGDGADDGIVLEVHAGAVTVEAADVSLSGCTGADTMRRVCSGVTAMDFRGEGGKDFLYVREGEPGIPLSAQGGSGDDWLHGSRGVDILDGGPGADLFSPVPGGAAGDAIDGGTDEDRLSFSGYQPYTVGVHATLPEPGASTTGNGAPGEGLKLTSIESVEGGSGADVLVGSSGPNMLAGDGGADELHGGEGDDELSGDDGKRLQDSLGGWISNGETDIDQLFGDGGADHLDARDGTAESVACGSGPDVARIDLPGDAAPDCEGLVPQIQGDLHVTGEAIEGRPLTATVVDVLGSPSIGVSYTWHGCGRYSCGPAFASGSTYVPDAAHTGYYSRVGTVATATNAFGSDSRSTGGREITPAWAVPPRDASPGGGAIGGSGDGGLPGAEPDRRALAQRALSGRLVKVRELTVAPLTAFRRPGAPLVSRAKKGTPVLALAAGRLGAVVDARLTLRLGRRGTRAIRLPSQRLPIAAASATVLKARLTAAQRARLRRAGRSRLAIELTVRAGSQTLTASGVLPVT